MATANKKKEILKKFSLAPKINQEPKPQTSIDIDLATAEIHATEKAAKNVEVKPNETHTAVTTRSKERKKNKARQPVVNVQVPTPKDLYIKIKSLIIDREDIKGIKYLYLDAVEYYLKNKIHER